MNKNQERPKRILDWFRGIIKKYGDIQKNLSEQAQEFGYSKDIFEKASHQYENVVDDPILDDVEQTLTSHLRYLKDYEGNLRNFLAQSKQASYIAFSTASTATFTAATIHPSFFFETLSPPLSWKPERRKEYIEKMSKLDKELGKAYASIWETFYATKESPEKTSLYAMRQTFDHLFRILAPDEEVRNSLYFSEKAGDNKDQVHRSERLRYAAYTKVKDRTMGELLASKTKQTLDTYEKLNKMHLEKVLNRENVREILTAMQSVLEEWIDAIGI